MHHGNDRRNEAVSLLTQTIANHAGKRAVTNNGLRFFYDHCIIYSEFTVCTMINSHSETLLSI